MKFSKFFDDFDFGVWCDKNQKPLHLLSVDELRVPVIILIYDHFGQNIFRFCFLFFRKKFIFSTFLRFRICYNNLDYFLSIFMVW